MQSKILGVTGLIASGKSTFARVFERFGAYVIDADKEAHRVLLKNGGAYNAVIAAFGREILADDDEIDRKKLGGIVFSDRKYLDILTNITRPIIYDNITMYTSTIADRIALIDAVFLYEDGLHRLCGSWYFIDCDELIRLERLLERDNITREMALKRISSQNQQNLRNPQKLAAASAIITNTGNKAEFILKIEELAREIFENY